MQMKRLTSWLLVFAFMLSMIPTAFAAGGSERESAAPTKIDGTTVWSYLDDNSDPAGDPTADGYDLTSWTAAGFDDSEWTSAAGSFGTKNGSLHTGAATKLNGCPDNENNYPTFYFRTKVSIEDASAVTKITGSISSDDAVILYINGVKAKGFNEAGCASNSSFCTNVSNGNPASENFEITASSVLSALNDGENTVAVELHNHAGNSSDIFFGMSDMAFSTDPLETTAHQSNISLSMGGDESQMNFTWYSALENASLLISDNEDMTDALTIAATSDTADGQYSCKAEVGDLKPGTTYYYQLENGGNKSGVYHFTTGGSGDFSFAFVGDPQIGASGNAGSDTTGWGKTLDLIKTDDRFSDVSFLLSAGDQVDTHNNENQYDSYLDHDVLTGLPSATVIGNHDPASDTYSKQFSVANESSQYGKTNAGGDSYFVYNKTLFLILNSNNLSTAEHRQFMLDSISAVEDQDIQWKIVVFHHSVYSVASHAVDKDILSRRDALVPVFKELDIDAVLMGHDHVYVRSYMMDGLQPTTGASVYDDEDYSSITDPTGILYVTANSASGSKFYTIKDSPFEYAAVQNQERVPNVSKVSVGEDHFTVTTYRTSDMSVVNTFTINRSSSQEAGYPITFASDGYAAIDVYNTQDYTTPSKTNVDSAVARNSDTGKIDMTGYGQVNFKVNVAEGREIDKVEADKNYRTSRIWAAASTDSPGSKAL